MRAPETLTARAAPLRGLCLPSFPAWARRSTTVASASPAPSSTSRAATTARSAASATCAARRSRRSASSRGSTTRGVCGGRRPSWQPGRARPTRESRLRCVSAASRTPPGCSEALWLGRCEERIIRPLARGRSAGDLCARVHVGLPVLDAAIFVQYAKAENGGSHSLFMHAHLHLGCLAGRS